MSCSYDQPGLIGNTSNQLITAHLCAISSSCLSSAYRHYHQGHSKLSDLMANLSSIGPWARVLQTQPPTRRPGQLGSPSQKTLPATFLRRSLPSMPSFLVCRGTATHSHGNKQLLAAYPEPYSYGKWPNPIRQRPRWHPLPVIRLPVSPEGGRRETVAGSCCEEQPQGQI